MSEAITLLGNVGLDILAQREEWSRVRARYTPGQLEYEHAAGAIMALDILADKAAVALTTRHADRFAVIPGGRA